MRQTAQTGPVEGGRIKMFDDRLRNTLGSPSLALQIEHPIW